MNFKNIKKMALVAGLASFINGRAVSEESIEQETATMRHMGYCDLSNDEKPDVLIYECIPEKDESYKNILRIYVTQRDETRIRGATERAGFIMMGSSIRYTYSEQERAKRLNDIILDIEKRTPKTCLEWVSQELGVVEVFGNDDKKPYLRLHQPKIIKEGNKQKIQCYSFSYHKGDGVFEPFTLAPR